MLKVTLISLMLKTSLHWERYCFRFSKLIQCPFLFCSLVDRAHLKLAAAKAVLRLLKKWEHRIPVNVLYLALRSSEVESDLYYCK